MKQNEKFRFVALSHLVVEKDSQLEKFCKTKGKLLTEFPNGVKAENSQNVSFFKNRKEISMESEKKLYERIQL